MGDEEEDGSASGGDMEVEEGSHPPADPSSTSSPDSDSMDDFLLEEFAAEEGAVGIREGLVGSLLGAGMEFLEPMTGNRLAEFVFNCSATSLPGLLRFRISGILLFFPPMFPALPSTRLVKLSFFALCASFRLDELLKHLGELSFP